MGITTCMHAHVDLRRKRRTGKRLVAGELLGASFEVWDLYGCGLCRAGAVKVEVAGTAASGRWALVSTAAAADFSSGCASLMPCYVCC